MPPYLAQQTYAAVSTHGEDHDESVSEGPRKAKSQHNFKPNPLRISFLAVVILILAVCITLIEILLRSTIELPSSSLETKTPSPSAKLKFLRPRRQAEYQVQPRQALNCANVAAIPGQLASLEAAESNLCVEFSSSYAAHTKNLSYPQQTSLEQWIVSFSAASSSSVQLSLTSAECQTSKSSAAVSTHTSSPEGGDGMTALRAGCGTTMVKTGQPDCFAVAGLTISGFSLVTEITIVCAASINNELVITTPTATPSPTKPSEIYITESSANPSSALIIAAPVASPSANTPSSSDITRSVTKGNDLALSSPSPALVGTTPGNPAPTSELVASQSSGPAPVAVPTSPLPTITQQEQPNPVTGSSQPAPTTVLIVGPVSPSATNASPAGPVQAGPASVTPIAQVTTFMVTESNGQVQTVVATAPALPVANTYITTDLNGQIQTVVPNSAATVPIVYTMATTNANGQVQTIVSTASQGLPGLFLYATTDSSGHVQTFATQLAGQPSVLQTVVITNAQGQIETLVAPASAIIPTMTTYTVTDAQGYTRVATASAYALVGAFTTYTTTDSRGQVETIVSQLRSPTSGYQTTTHYTSLISTTDAAGRSTTYSAVVVQTITLSTSPVPDSARQTISAASPASTLPKPAFAISSQERIVNAKFTYGSYVLALYVPAFLAVLVKAVWATVFAAIRLVEPFEKMAAAHGATAEYSIFAQYLSSSLSFDAFASLTQGNPVPLWASVVYVLLQAGAPVATASMSVKARSYCLVNGVQMRCDPAWIVNLPFLRAVEVALAVCLALVLLISWSVTRSRSGISSNPSSLASLAVLMNHQPLLDDIQKIDPDTDCETFRKAMSQHQFRLDYHTIAPGTIAYGIIGLRSGKHDPEQVQSERDRIPSNAYLSNTNRDAYTYHSISNTGMSASSSYTRTSVLSRARSHVITDTLGLLLPLTVFALVLTWYFDSNNDPLNNFFNSNTLWPKFVLVSLATLCALHLSHIERVVRITEPFRRLAANSSSNPALQHRSSPKTTLLVSRSGTPYSNLLQCLGLFFSQDILRRGRGKMSFQTLVTLTAILADLNIIAAAGVAFNDAQTWEVYQVSSIATITISAWIVVVYLVILFWWRRCESVRAVSEDAMGLSTGIGTLGGAMRWLLSGGNSQNVLEAIVNVQEGAEGRWRRRRNDDTEYRGRDGELSPSRPRIWFGKLGVMGASGRERWGFGVDERTEVRERTLPNHRTHEQGADSLGGYEDYFGPRARGQNRSSESLDREEAPLHEQPRQQVVRYPSLHGSDRRSQY